MDSWFSYLWHNVQASGFFLEPRGSGDPPKRCRGYPPPPLGGERGFRPGHVRGGVGGTPLPGWRSLIGMARFWGNLGLWRRTHTSGSEGRLVAISRLLPRKGKNICRDRHYRLMLHIDGDDWLTKLGNFFFKYDMCADRVFVAIWDVIWLLGIGVGPNTFVDGTNGNPVALIFIESMFVLMHLCFYSAKIIFLYLC